MLLLSLRRALKITLFHERNLSSIDTLNFIKFQFFTDSKHRKTFLRVFKNSDEWPTSSCFLMYSISFWIDLGSSEASFPLEGHRVHHHFSLVRGFWQCQHSCHQKFLAVHLCSHLTISSSAKVSETGSLYAKLNKSSSSPASFSASGCSGAIIFRPDICGVVHLTYSHASAVQ